MNDMNHTKPAWLTAAELKAMQLRTAAETERAKISGIAEEIGEVNSNLNALQRRRQDYVNGHVVADQKAQAIAALDAEIGTLQAHLDGARTRQDALRTAPAPLIALATSATNVVRALQDHAKLETLQYTDSPIARAIQSDTTADAPKATKSLKALRSEIAEVRTEAIAVKNALRPVADLEASVRHLLGDMASARDQFVNLIANIFSHGYPISDLVAIPAGQVPKHALGMALAAIGVDAIVAEAKKKAEANDSGALRMSARDQEEQLEALERQLFDLECQEESALNGEPRRPGANPAAVLAVPIEVAAAAGFLKIKGN